MSKPAKAAVKEDIRTLSGAERAAIIMLSLGEEHSQQVWKMMDEDEIKEKLARAGFSASRALQNIGHNPWRMTFVARHALTAT